MISATGAAVATAAMAATNVMDAATSIVVKIATAARKPAARPATVSALLRNATAKADHAAPRLAPAINAATRNNEATVATPIALNLARKAGSRHANHGSLANRGHRASRVLLRKAQAASRVNRAPRQPKLGHPAKPRSPQATAMAATATAGAVTGAGEVTAAIGRNRGRAKNTRVQRLRIPKRPRTSMQSPKQRWSAQCRRRQLCRYPLIASKLIARWRPTSWCLARQRRRASSLQSPSPRRG
jgi:hypothetical protein